MLVEDILLLRSAMRSGYCDVRLYVSCIVMEKLLIVTRHERSLDFNNTLVSNEKVPDTKCRRQITPIYV